jgi:uncharacterized protein (UPF0335 family)
VLESLSSEEMQFIKAIERYKKESGKLFPSWSDVLKILKDLGYRRQASAAKTATVVKKSNERKKQPTA